MAQPSERLLLELPHPFTGEAQLLPQLLQRARRLLSQPIPTDDHLVKSLGQPTDQVEQDVPYQTRFHLRRRVRHDPRRWHLL